MLNYRVTRLLYEFFFIALIQLGRKDELGLVHRLVARRVNDGFR